LFPIFYIFAEYVHIGCFQDKLSDRALSKYFGKFALPPTNAIQKCAESSSKKGFLVFGVEYNGECYSSPDSEFSYNKHGSANNCKDGVGGDWSFDAYRFKGEVLTLVLTFITKYIDSQEIKVDFSVCVTSCNYNF